MAEIRTIKLPADDIRRLYHTEGLTQSAIATHYGVSKATIRRFLSKNGIPFRPHTETQARLEKTAAWKGDDAGYVSLHIRVRRQRGTPKHCERCGLADESRVYDWANLTGNYSNVWDYERMCRPCHRRFDNQKKRTAIRNYVDGLVVWDEPKELSL